jgi:hypothetical protein
LEQKTHILQYYLKIFPNPKLIEKSAIFNDNNQQLKKNSTKRSAPNVRVFTEKNFHTQIGTKTHYFLATEKNFQYDIHSSSLTEKNFHTQIGTKTHYFLETEKNFHKNPAFL